MHCVEITAVVECDRQIQFLRLDWGSRTFVELYHADPVWIKLAISISGITKGVISWKSVQIYTADMMPEETLYSFILVFMSPKS